MSGCTTLPTLDRSTYPEVFEPLEQIDRLLEQARGTGKDKDCPVAYNGVLKIRKEAEATYWTCQTAKAEEMAQMALEKAKGLCPDTDRDGVPDYRDKCSDTPEGAAVDGNGCPLDSDGDGVVDVRDQCPGTPKGANVDLVGCWAVRHILFDKDKTDIKPAGARELDAVVEVLKANPDLRIKIAGHTDNEGTAAYNQTLSENRARAVWDYLTKQGIPGGRFPISGYGFSRPVANNATPEGRSLNRRVELTPAR